MALGFITYSIWGIHLLGRRFFLLLVFRMFSSFFHVEMPITEYNKSVCCTLERISQLKISLGCSRSLIINCEYWSVISKQFSFFSYFCFFVFNFKSDLLRNNISVFISGKPIFWGRKSFSFCFLSHYLILILVFSSHKRSIIIHFLSHSVQTIYFILDTIILRKIWFFTY